MNKTGWLHRISALGCIVVAVGLIARINSYRIQMSSDVSSIQAIADAFASIIGSPVPVTYDWPLTSLTARACFTGASFACVDLPNYHLYIIILVILLVADLAILAHALGLFAVINRKVTAKPSQ